MTHPWTDVLSSEKSTPLWQRIMMTVALFAVVIVGGVLVWVLLLVREDLDGNKTDLLDAGLARLEVSVSEHTRTQTMVCFAHPLERDTNPTFDRMCDDVIRRWQVNAEGPLGP